MLFVTTAVNNTRHVEFAMPCSCVCFGNILPSAAQCWWRHCQASCQYFNRTSGQSREIQIKHSKACNFLSDLSIIGTMFRNKNLELCKYTVKLSIHVPRNTDRTRDDPSSHCSALVLQKASVTRAITRRCRRNRVRICHGGSWIRQWSWRYWSEIL